MNKNLVKKVALSRGEALRQKNKSILFTCRDDAASRYIAAISQYLTAQGHFTINIVAQENAKIYLAEQGIKFIDVPFTASTVKNDHLYHENLRFAETLVAALKPDSLVVGLSSPGRGGIDEAMLAVASCPTFLVQDYWGEYNNYFGVLPDCFFVLDEFASKLTSQKLNTKTVIMGSPRHANFENLNLDRLRFDGRVRYGIKRDSLVYGWFGQALHSVSGYHSTVNNWAEIIASFYDSISVPLKVVYKPHPREFPHEISKTINIISRHIDVITIDNETIEQALTICDYVSSIISNCLYDASYLNFSSPEPAVIPISTIIDEELRGYLAKMNYLDGLPYQKSDIVFCPKSYDELCSIMDIRSHERLGYQVHQAARKTLCSPKSALATYYEYFYKFLYR